MNPYWFMFNAAGIAMVSVAVGSLFFTDGSRPISHWHFVFVFGLLFGGMGLWAVADFMWLPTVMGR